MVFNFYPQYIGIITNPTDRVFLPLLSDAFFRYLPWLDLLWVLGIGLQLALLRLGRYTPVTRWIDVALRAGGVALAVAMLRGPSLVGITAAQLIAAGMESASAGVLVNMFNLAVKFALVIGVVAGSVEIIKEVYRMVSKSRRLTPVIPQ